MAKIKLKCYKFVRGSCKHVLKNETYLIICLSDTENKIYIIIKVLMVEVVASAECLIKQTNTAFCRDVFSLFLAWVVCIVCVFAGRGVGGEGWREGSW